MRYLDDDAQWSLADEVESELEGFRIQLAREERLYEEAQDEGNWPMAERLLHHVRFLRELIAGREAEWAHLVAHGGRHAD